MACYPSSVVNFSHFQHLLQNHKSDWAETWWEALAVHGNSELLKLLHFHIQQWWPSWNCSDEISSPEPKVGLSWNLMEGIEGTWRFRIAEIILFRYPRWLPWWLSRKSFKPHLRWNAKSDWNQTWWKALGWHGNSELLKLFRSIIQDGHHQHHSKSDWTVHKLNGSHLL